MKTGHQRIAISLLETNKGQIEGLPANPRQWTKAQFEQLKASIKETPELLEARGCIVDYHDGKYVCLGGNMRYMACKDLGMTEVPCYVIPEGTSVLKKKEIVAKDNVSMGDWDFDALANEWSDLDLEGWGVSIPPEWGAACDRDKKATEQEEIERKKKEFEERIAAGELREEDEEYQAFLAKFQTAKTTDDCYTPQNVYEAVVSFVVKTYGVKEKDFIRPFYPNGNYQEENYPHDCVVVDNPPFSILSEIITFYEFNKIKYFLFAPTLTLFSSSSSTTSLPIGVGIRYDNGANVNTSFLTNLEPRNVRVRSCPELYKLLKKANEDNLREQRKELPRYEYDMHVITSTMVGQFSRYGIDFVVPRFESERIGGLESQKKVGKGIFGSGYLISDGVMAEREKAEREKAEREKAEREKAEREKAEREKAERWELSEKELAIVARLNAAREIE